MSEREGRQRKSCTPINGLKCHQMQAGFERVRVAKSSKGWTIISGRHFKRRSPLPPKKEVEKARLADACLTRTTSAIDCFLPRLFLIDNNRYCQTSYFSFVDWIMKKNSLCCKKKIFLKIYKFEYVYLCVISVQQSRKLSRSNEMYALLKLLR